MPGPPATLALFAYANRTAQGEVTDLKDFWNGLRGSWRLAWRWGVVNLAVLGLLAGDFYLTGRVFPTAAGLWLQGLYLVLLLGWLGWQAFALAFLFEQEELRVRLSLRNAAVLIGRNPVFSGVWLLGVLVVLALGALAFMLSGAFGAVFVALAGNYAVLERLVAYRTAQRRNDEPAAPS
ncbi:MAG TPA: hypothetical protein VLS48_03545 [Anaerolineales bacterium]|nr:hypothetical protein [Anaerolineales bacterium]